MVGLAQKLVIIVTMLAGLFAALGASLPGAIPTTVPALCVQLPQLGAGFQAGYCP